MQCPSCKEGTLALVVNSGLMQCDRCGMLFVNGDKLNVVVIKMGDEILV